MAKTDDKKEINLKEEKTDSFISKEILITRNVVTKQTLLEHGVHFGHYTNKWNPQMKSYIQGVKNNTHIINLDKTINNLNRAYKKLYEITKKDGKVLFVGTSNKAINTVQQNAIRSGSFYITNRWLGGTLTNFQTIKKSIDKFKEYERLAKTNFDGYTKKESVNMYKILKKMEANLTGIKYMRYKPSAIILSSSIEDNIALAEARKLNIPIFAIVDSNGDPEGIDYMIPSNDDANKSLALIITLLSDAICDAKGLQRKAALMPEKSIEVLGINPKRKRPPPTFQNNNRKSDNWKDRNYKSSSTHRNYGNNNELEPKSIKDKINFSEIEARKANKISETKTINKTINSNEKLSTKEMENKIPSFNDMLDQTKLKQPETKFPKVKLVDIDVTKKLKIKPINQEKIHAKEDEAKKIKKLAEKDIRDVKAKIIEDRKLKKEIQHQEKVIQKTAVTKQKKDEDIKKISKSKIDLNKKISESIKLIEKAKKLEKQAKQLLDKKSKELEIAQNDIKKISDLSKNQEKILSDERKDEEKKSKEIKKSLVEAKRKSNLAQQKSLEAKEIKRAEQERIKREKSIEAARKLVVSEKKAKDLEKTLIKEQQQHKIKVEKAIKHLRLSEKKMSEIKKIEDKVQKDVDKTKSKISKEKLEIKSTKLKAQKVHDKAKMDHEKAEKIIDDVNKGKK